MRAKVAVSAGKTETTIARPTAIRTIAASSSGTAKLGTIQAAAKQAVAPSSDRGASDGKLTISQSPTSALPNATTARKTFASTFG